LEKTKNNNKPGHFILLKGKLQLLCSISTIPQKHVNGSAPLASRLPPFRNQHLYTVAVKILHQLASSFKLSYLGPVWFVAKCATLCLRLVVQIEYLTLGRKVRQSVAT
jgi:hypothetical protein